MTPGIGHTASRSIRSASVTTAPAPRAAVGTYRRYQQTELISGVHTTAVLATPPHATPISRAAGGVLSAGVGLVLGALSGGLIGLVISFLMVAGPDIRLPMVLGGAGEGSLGGILIGSLMAILILEAGLRPFEEA